MSARTSHLAASMHQRLLNESRSRQVDFNLLLTRFANERLLYRLARSPYVEQFVLKGAMLLQTWLPELGRPTRDLDLLGFGNLSADRLGQIFADICNQPVEADGVRFLSSSVTVHAIREQDEYGGQRVTLLGHLGSARLHVQVDVGSGDRLTPPAQWIDYPVLLDLPQPRLRAYRAETTIAEKLHAMVWLDMQNSRLKDFFDIWSLAKEHSFSGDLLVDAVRNTFDRRQTPIPLALPTAMTPTFASNPVKVQLWQAFLRRSQLRHVNEDLAVVIQMIAEFLGPVLDAVRNGSAFPLTWQPGGPWKKSQVSTEKGIASMPKLWYDDRSR